MSDSAIGASNPLRQRVADEQRHAGDVVFGDVIRIRESQSVVVLDIELGAGQPGTQGFGRDLLWDVIGQVVAILPTPRGVVLIVDQVRPNKCHLGKITLWMHHRHPVWDV